MIKKSIWVLLAAAIVLPLTAQDCLALEGDIIQVTLPSSGEEGAIIKGTSSEIYGYADHFVKTGYYHYARICYETLIEANAGDARANILLGRLYQNELKKLAKAVTYYKRAERLVPSNNQGGKALCQRLSADVYRALAEKSNSLIFFVQAISEYEKIIRYNPGNIEVLYYLASCRLNTNEYDLAISIYKKVIDEDPKSEWAKLSGEAVKVAQNEKRRKRS